jgi:hypothetical protein
MHLFEWRRHAQPGMLLYSGNQNYDVMDRFFGRLLKNLKQAIDHFRPAFEWKSGYE